MRTRTLIALLLLAAPALAQGETILWDASAGPAGATLCAPSANCVSDTSWESRAGGSAVRLTVAKTDEMRRFVGWSVDVPEAAAVGARSVRLALTSGLEAAKPAHVALIAFGPEGTAWTRLSREVLAEPAEGGIVLSLEGLSPAAFSSDPARAWEAGLLERLWVGAVLEGPASGWLGLSRVTLSPEPYRSTTPVPLMPIDQAAWSAGVDPAVTWTLTVVNEGPKGEPCVRFDFEMPGGRHMFAVPAFAVDSSNLDGAGGLRLTYRADLPAGIGGLLFMVGEHGGQFAADPAPPGGGEWQTVTVPFSSFPLGGWSKDDNGTLEPAAADRIFVGLHGSAQGDVVRGTLRILSVDAMP